ncbi:hypothetical protein V5799_018357 [Amblyomma americanum]|uniref:Protein phosphatase n=1 Tax=Amblyomma americanum TaxID=6943 RepID=A0AAQ4EZH9_AMBAM
MQSVLMYGRILTRALANSVFSYSTCTTSSDAKYAWAKGDLGLQTVTCGFPKERKRFSIGLGRGQFGDDACFAAKYKSFDVLGVADGVGGWRTYGVDPSLFSTALMRNCERVVHSGRFKPNSPASIIASSYYELLENKRHIIEGDLILMATDGLFDNLPENMIVSELAQLRRGGGSGDTRRQFGRFAASVTAVCVRAAAARPARSNLSFVAAKC